MTLHEAIKDHVFRFAYDRETLNAEGETFLEGVRWMLGNKTLIEGLGADNEWKWQGPKISPQFRYAIFPSTP